ncbi:DUF5906 domain-containing protein [Jannaschia sp. CCS1]|uniref:DUF5906 domain-containing protein n=1 Tax=Jannaschia sp. (strain CCS1) TaxID=290400 RepID=UPI00140FA756|nr:DUF5906 domain-containing protein [Jannaschia sp. CCS1]
MLPDPDASVAFLEGWRSGGPWVLTAIEVDPPKGRDPRTPTVALSAPEKARQWITDHSGGGWNLYFTVNVTRGPVGKKPKKADMAAATGLHVDVDPRPGEDIDRERARAEKVLRGYGPQPTVIIDSGGGFQGFWKFDEELHLTGEPEDETRHLPVEERNLKIEAVLQGDSCHNVDRVMRLPGTVNWPNDKKRKKGRKPALAQVVDVDWSRTYAPGDFERSPMFAKSASSGTAQVTLPKDLPELLGLESLPTAVSDRTKMLITVGDDPDDPMRYASRSEVLFAVLCELVRAEVADDVIAAVILDEDYGISGHINDQADPRRYARRQIQRARDEAVDPALRELNDQFTVLENEGGKCRILEFVEMPTGVKGKTRSVVTLQSFEDFRNRFLNRSVVVGKDKEGNDVKMALGKWWLQNAARRQFHSLTFRPRDGEEVGTGATRQLNLWQGFTVRPTPGDWSLMRAHIRDVLASGDEASDSYIIRWMAWTLQNPDEPAEVALTFRGEPGTGKGVFGRTMAQLFGQHGLHTGGSEMITGRFNKHFRDCCLLFADEVVWDGDRKAEAKVKTFLTEPTLMIEGKGVDAVTWPNMLHVIISSNSEWVVPAGPFERRYAVFDVAATQRQKRGYFAPLFAELESGGLAAMLCDLLAMDLGRWHPREDVPKTDALNDQKSRGLDPVHAAVLDMLREGALPSDISADARGTDARPFVATDELAAFVQRQSRAVVTSVVVSKLLDKIGGEKNRKRRPSGYVLPLLAEARAAWDAQPDLPTQIWDDAADWAGGGEPW